MNQRSVDIRQSKTQLSDIPSLLTHKIQPILLNPWPSILEMTSSSKKRYNSAEGENTNKPGKRLVYQRFSHLML